MSSETEAKPLHQSKRLSREEYFARIQKIKEARSELSAARKAFEEQMKDLRKKLDAVMLTAAECHHVHPNGHDASGADGMGYTRWCDYCDL